MGGRCSAPTVRISGDRPVRDSTKPRHFARRLQKGARLHQNALRLVRPFGSAAMQDVSSQAPRLNVVDARRPPPVAGQRFFSIFGLISAVTSHDVKLQARFCCRPGLMTGERGAARTPSRIGRTAFSPRAPRRISKAYPRRFNGSRSSISGSGRGEPPVEKLQTSVPDLHPFPHNTMPHDASPSGTGCREYAAGVRGRG